MTIKFLKQWGQHLDGHLENRDSVQTALDGGCAIKRMAEVVECFDVFVLPSPGAAVKFAAALNKLRRPLHLVKQDLDADWAARVKARDSQTCALCGVMGAKENANGKGKDALTAHHWLKNKARAGMARWSRPCGVTVHFAEHIHLLHENPCWMDLEPISKHVTALEGEEAIQATLRLVAIAPTEALVRRLWLERCGAVKAEEVRA